MDRVPVYVSASDPISRAGIVATLRHRPEVQLLEEDELAGADGVAVVLVDRIDDAALGHFRQLQGLRCTRIVVVPTVLDDADLMTAVEAGVCGLVRRTEATAERLVEVVRIAAAGQGSLPPDLLGRLLNQVSRLQRQVLAPRGLRATGLSERETDVLRLVAEGHDTQEIARRLSYSERTIKNILHDVTSRLQVRNRSHAVAFALREGLI